MISNNLFYTINDSWWRDYYCETNPRELIFNYMKYNVFLPTKNNVNFHTDDKMDGSVHRIRELYISKRSQVDYLYHQTSI